MQKRLHTIWLAVFLLLLHWTVSVVHAAELKIEKTLNETDGLASNTVLTIFEDSRGNMWFGTTDGLTRYDGENFRTFTTEDGLSRNTTGLIFEDRHGMLWFANGVVLSTFERGKPIDMSYMAMPLSELAKELENEIPTETLTPTPPRGVSRYDGDMFRIFTRADGLLRDNVKDMFQDKTGMLWFATSSGVNRYEAESFTGMVLNGPLGMDILPDWWNQVKTITQDTAGNFWFGSTAGITYYDVQTSDFRYFDVNFMPFQEMGKAQTGHVTDLQFDVKDNLWISREGMGDESSGIRRYDGEALVSFPQSEALPMNSVHSILLDTNGNLWFSGTKKLSPMLRDTEDSLTMTYAEAGVGVSVYNGETFQNFNTDDGLPSNKVWSVFEDSSGKLWFATDTGAAVGVYLPSKK